jgi:dihydroorotase
VLLDPAELWTVDPKRFASRSRNTPIAGWELPGRIRRTIVAGETRYAVEENR